MGYMYPSADASLPLDAGQPCAFACIPLETSVTKVAGPSAVLASHGVCLTVACRAGVQMLSYPTCILSYVSVQSRHRQVAGAQTHWPSRGCLPVVQPV